MFVFYCPSSSSSENVQLDRIITGTMVVVSMADALNQKVLGIEAKLKPYKKYELSFTTTSLQFSNLNEKCLLYPIQLYYIVGL